MGALAEVLAAGGDPTTGDLREATWSDLHRVASVDSRVRPLDPMASEAETFAWLDSRADAAYLVLNRYPGPLGERLVDADRTRFAAGEVWARVFELYHDPATLPEEAHGVYRTMGDHVRHGAAPYHARVFGNDLAVVDLDAADSDREGAWRVAEPGLIADLRALFLRQWAASRPLLGRSPDTDALVLVRLLAADRPDEEAAAALGVSPFTYRRRVADLLAALGTDNRFAAGVTARRRGLLALAEAVA